jgi:adenine-specific DNA-methyltransferase
MGKRKTSRSKKGETQVQDYRHESEKRKNLPPAKIAAEGVIPAVPKVRYEYNPHLSPMLRFDQHGQADELPELLVKAKHRALTNDEAKLLAEALRKHEPWLEWTNKREAKHFEVDPVALHIHERVSAQAILKVARRQDVQRTLFGDPEQEYHEAVQFYRHDVDWTNRLILGDSLEVMSSLAKRENLAGKVQMVYLDPPYGINFARNFQTEIWKRPDMGTTRDRDMTREPEMVKAYRDTWQLGIHSYLGYLRDRLYVAKELLAQSGSVFVQMSDDHIHRVRQLLDEIFGGANFISQIQVQKTGTQTGEFLVQNSDFVLWYAKSRPLARDAYHQLYTDRPTDKLRSDQGTGDDGGWSPDPMTSDGFRQTTTVDFSFQGRRYHPGVNRHWGVEPAKLRRAASAERIVSQRDQIRFKKYFADYPVTPLGPTWDDVGGARGKQYVVQTTPKVIERCLLMSTNPGDLVLDPTCGGGTTAYVAEKWGRRWISIDTSRVAVAIARQRLLTETFERYRVQGEKTYAGTGNRLGVDPRPGLAYKRVPHITLQSIAHNESLDDVFAKHDPLLVQLLEKCNAALTKLPEGVRHICQQKLLLKQKEKGKRAITEADQRRWLLPPENRGGGSERSKRQKDYTVDLEFAGWYHWELPWDTDDDWPEEIQQAVSECRKAWREKMAEVNACIAANADQEELVDRPEVVKGIVRVSGPFTVEAVQPPEMSVGDTDVVASPMVEDGLFDGEPGQMATFELRPVESFADTQNIPAYLEKMIRLLKTDAVTFPNNRVMKFSRLEPIFAENGAGLHAEGRWQSARQADDDPEGAPNVCVVFGPQYGPVTAKQVEEVVRPANRAGYEDLVIAGFSFDGAAQAVIEEAGADGRIRLHMAHIRPDVNPGMDGLLKEQPGSQLFTVFGQPRTCLKGPDDNGQYVVMMEGVDIYNPVDNSITPTKADKVAAWFIDGDYDGRTFCITQAFFPDPSAWDKLARALKGVVDKDRFEALSGTSSLPFPAGQHKCVAVKVIDPRGNEVMRAHYIHRGDGDG